MGTVTQTKGWALKAWGHPEHTRTFCCSQDGVRLRFWMLQGHCFVQAVLHTPNMLLLCPRDECDARSLELAPL